MCKYETKDSHQKSAVLFQRMTTVSILILPMPGTFQGPCHGIVMTMSPWSPPRCPLVSPAADTGHASCLYRDNIIQYSTVQHSTWKERWLRLQVLRHGIHWQDWDWHLNSERWEVWIWCCGAVLSFCLVIHCPVGTPFLPRFVWNESVKRKKESFQSSRRGV